MTKKQEWQQITYLRRVIKDRKTPINKKPNGNTVGGVDVTDETLEPYMKKLSHWKQRCLWTGNKCQQLNAIIGRATTLQKPPLTVMRPLCNHYATTMQLPNMQLLCNHYATTMQPLCNYYATTTQPLVSLTFFFLSYFIIFGILYIKTMKSLELFSGTKSVG